MPLPLREVTGVADERLCRRTGEHTFRHPSRQLRRKRADTR